MTMSVGFAMAKTPKKKPGPKPIPAGEQRDEIVAVRCRGVWKTWLEGFADHQRSTPTSMIDKALAEMAKSAGYQDPPKR
jgi:hypothetical protein